MNSAEVHKQPSAYKRIQMGHEGVCRYHIDVSIEDILIRRGSCPFLNRKVRYKEPGQQILPLNQYFDQQIRSELQHE
jgi:hypothetical protein